jgi:hypothetical protein
MAEPFRDLVLIDVSFTEIALAARAQGKLPLSSPVSTAVKSGEQACLRVGSSSTKAASIAGARHLVDLVIAEKPKACEASSYSCFSEVWKNGGSSELMVTRTPACIQCAQRMRLEIGKDLQRDVGAGQTSSTVPSSASRLTRSRPRWRGRRGRCAKAARIERIAHAEGAADFAGMDGEAETGNRGRYRRPGRNRRPCACAPRRQD